MIADSLPRSGRIRESPGCNGTIKALRDPVSPPAFRRCGNGRTLGTLQGEGTGRRNRDEQQIPWAWLSGSRRRIDGSDS